MAVGNLGTRKYSATPNFHAKDTLVVGETHISLRFLSPVKMSTGKVLISRELFRRSLKTDKETFSNLSTSSMTLACTFYIIVAVL